MARDKRIDFEKAKEEQQVLSGFVKMAQTSTEYLNEEEPFIIVICNYRRVKIYKHEIKPLPFNQSIVALVGTMVSFILLEYDKEADTGIGSNLQAVNMQLKPVTDALISGKVMKGTIIRIVPHGAYISVQGVHTLMRNKDFSDNGTTIKEMYREGQPIKVVYSKTTDKGTIIVNPDKKIEGENILKVSDFTRGQIVIGKIVNVYPDRVYVNISPKIDVMCQSPEHIARIEIGEIVKLMITKVDIEASKIRGRVLDLLS